MMTPTAIREYKFVATCKECGFSKSKVVETDPKNVLVAQRQFVEEPEPEHTMHSQSVMNVVTYDEGEF